MYKFGKFVIGNLKNGSNRKKYHINDDIKSNELCLLRPDTGNVICPSHMSLSTNGIWKGQNYIPLDRPSKHVYLVPKRCVEWKSSYPTTRVFYKTLMFTLKMQATNDEELGYFKHYTYIFLFKL